MIIVPAPVPIPLATHVVSAGSCTVGLCWSLGAGHRKGFPSQSSFDITSFDAASFDIARSLTPRPLTLHPSMSRLLHVRAICNFSPFLPLFPVL